MSCQPITDRRGRPLRDLRISLTDRCNLRCTYCMPKEVFGPGYAFLKKDQWLAFPGINDLVKTFVRLGARKLRLTGGEPLLRTGLIPFIRGLRQFPEIEDIALTTNGIALGKMAVQLRSAGLRRVTVSLDALDDAICGRMNGVGLSSEPVLAGIDAARTAGLPVKVNMVVERGVNDGEILPMARYFKKIGVTLRFIEFMDVGNCNQWNLERVMSGKEILTRLADEFEVEPVDLTSRNEVAKRYRYLDGSGEFGIITSVTEPFCGGCTRARISADGKLYTCLFASQGLDLKSILRSPDYSPDALFEKLARHWGLRDDRYSELRHEESPGTEKVEMSYIGG